MNPFVSYIVQTALSIGIFYLLYWLFLRQETFFRFNRYYFLASIVLAFIIPFLDFGNLDFIKDSFPVKSISYGYVSLQDPIPDISTAYLSEDSSKPSLAEYMLVLYLIGVGFLVFRLIYQMIKLFLKIWKARILRMYGTKIILDKKVNSPFSFFFWIFLNPSQIKDPKISDIILHEKEHIYQKHSFDLFLVELMCSLQWANPFVWLLRKSIKETHEYLADRAVLDHGIQVQDYQKLLLSQSMGVGYPALITPLNYSINKKRMIMMQKLKSPNIRKWRSLLIIPVVLLLSLAFSNPFSTHEVTGAQISSNQALFDTTDILDNETGALFILDGKEISQNEFKSLQYEVLSSVSVLKGEQAEKVYGEKGRNGVVVMKSRDIYNDQGEEINIVTGRVFDAETYEPIPAANIVILNKQTGTISDEKGNFMLEFTDESAQLSFSMLGYEKVIREVKDGDNIEVRLKRGSNDPVIYYKEEVMADPELQKYEISGKILDAPKGEPIPAANIIILNEKIGTISDDQGNFKLELPNENAQIAISMLGFEEVIREVKSGDIMEIRLHKLAIGSLAVPVKKFTSPYLQKYEASGKVVLAGSNEPIPGVSIVISNTHTGTVSDMQGNFKLQLPEESVQVVFTFVGLGTVKRQVKDGDKLAIKLKKTVANLNLDSPDVVRVEEVVKEEFVKEVKSSPEIFYVVEDMPHFPGGKAKLSEYISTNIKYPGNAKKKKISGTVTVNFTVDKNGYVKNVFVAKGKGIDPNLDKEAIRVISGMPKWEPGSQRGKKVDVDLSVPVKFRL